MNWFLLATAAYLGYQALTTQNDDTRGWYALGFIVAALWLSPVVLLWTA